MPQLAVNNKFMKREIDKRDRDYHKLVIEISNELLSNRAIGSKVLGINKVKLI